MIAPAAPALPAMTIRAVTPGAAIYLGPLMLGVVHIQRAITGIMRIEAAEAAEAAEAETSR